MTLTRRRMVQAAGAVSLAGLTGLLSACGGDDAAPATGGAPSSGPWTWTDDRGETVSLDQRPERIVVSQWLLPAFWALGIKPVGVLTFMPWGDIEGYAEAGIEEGDVEVLSTNYGEVDLERMVGLQPDLIVLDWFAGSETLWGFTEVSSQRKAEQIAPLVGVSADAPAVEGIEARRELAAAMGADLESAEVVAAKQDFDDATEELRALLAEKGDLSVAVVGPFADGLWVAPAEDYADLACLAELGLNVWKPDPVPGDDILSWENAASVDADLILIDDRDDVSRTGADSPVFMALPAVEAGQVAAAWRFALPYEYAAFARSFRAVAEPIDAARILSR